jgi:serine/threonine-protein kinase mTOR
MLRVLLQKANDNNPTVAANILMCLGELACVVGEDAMSHVPDLIQVIISRLSDPSLIKRDAALHTLGQVCSSTGYVITPLIDYPQLLPLLSRILRTENSQVVRREVVKVLGIIGALDPYRRKVHFFSWRFSVCLSYCNMVYRAGPTKTLRAKRLQRP